MSKRLALGAVFALLLGAVVIVFYVAGRWSPEDNLTECKYEAHKLLVHMREDNSETVKKRSNLVYACMQARRFKFDSLQSRQMVRQEHARMPKPATQQEAIDQAQQLEMFDLEYTYAFDFLWSRDRERYWPF